MSNDKTRTMGEPQTAWVPVTERLPEEGVFVLAYWQPQPDDEWAAEPGPAVATRRGRGWVCTVTADPYEEAPTHWMPLPEGPNTTR